MATGKKSFLAGLVGGINAGLKATGAPEDGQTFGTAFWAFTTAYFAPNKQAFNVDGGRWGSNYSAMTQPEKAQEFAIAAYAIARELGQSKYVIERVPVNDQDDPKIITNPNDPFLRLLEQPNPLHSWQSWVETAALLLLTSGDLYVLEDPLSIAGTPMALYLLRSDRTQPIRANDEERRKNPLHLIHGYRYLAEDGLQYVFPADRVHHIKLPNMLTDYHGMGMVNLLQQTLEIDYRSMESNINLFRMGGRLNLVIEGVDNDDPTKIKEWQDKLMNAHAGSENANRPLILTGTAKVNAQASGNGAKEQDYTNTRADVSRAVGGMMGVPPLKMGQMKDINRASAVVEEQQFRTNAVWPTMRRLEPMFTLIGRKFHPLNRFSFPKSDVMDPEILAVMAKNLGETGAASPNDIRQKLMQWDRDRNPAMDKHYIYGPQQSIEDGITGPGGPVPGDPTPGGGKPLTGAEPAPAKKPAAAAPSPSNAPAKLSPLPSFKKSASKGEGLRPFPKGTRKQRRYLDAIRKARPAIEKKLAPIFERHILAVGKDMADAMEKRGGQQGKALSKSSGTAFLTAIRKAADDSGTQQGLQNQASVAYDAQLQNVAVQAAVIFDVQMADYGPDSPAFEEAKQYLAQRISGVDQTVKDEIGDLIQDGVNQGLSPWQIANGTTDGSFPGIRQAVEGMAQERAMLIARTETAHLQDVVHTEAFKQMGVTVCDVIGCEDFVVMPGEEYGCNSQSVPVGSLPIGFHPNHNGAVVPHVTEEAE
jgi:HK97 family phage portal protein